MHAQQSFFNASKGWKVYFTLRHPRWLSCVAVAYSFANKLCQCKQSINDKITVIDSQLTADSLLFPLFRGLHRSLYQNIKCHFLAERGKASYIYKSWKYAPQILEDYGYLNKRKQSCWASPKEATTSLATVVVMDIFAKKNLPTKHSFSKLHLSSLAPWLSFNTTFPKQIFQSVNSLVVNRNL